MLGYFPLAFLLHKLWDVDQLNYNCLIHITWADFTVNPYPSGSLRRVSDSCLPGAVWSHQTLHSWECFSLLVGNDNFLFPEQSSRCHLVRWMSRILRNVGSCLLGYAVTSSGFLPTLGKLSQVPSTVKLAFLSMFPSLPTCSPPHPHIQAFY